MKLISHRGNINGSDPMRENSPDYILEAIEKGFDVEIDIWYENGEFYSGHDFPQDEISLDFLINNKNKLWCHAKTIDTLYELIKLKLHTFFHNRDLATLTSKGFIWTYPNEDVTPKSVIVNNNSTVRKYNINIYGVCSDYIENWRK